METATVIVQELCESRGGRPALSVLTSLLASVGVKIYGTMLTHWSQLVPNMSADTTAVGNRIDLGSLSVSKVMAGHKIDSVHYSL